MPSAAIMAQVKAQDYPRYLMALCLPAQAQDAAFAALAWYAEIAAIPAKVREEMIGHIRFAWWREALEEMDKGKEPRAHPALKTVAPYIKGITFPCESLMRIVDAAEAEFAGQGEIGASSGELSALMLLLSSRRRPGSISEAHTGGKVNPGLRRDDESARHIGIAYTLAQSPDTQEAALKTLDHLPKKNLPKFLRAQAAIARYLARTQAKPPFGEKQKFQLTWKVWRA